MNATEVLVRKHIDWERVRCRLKRFPALGTLYPEEFLRSFARPPYYCHYMAWRLGTWHWEGGFENFERLLQCAEKLPNWQLERGTLVNDGRFETYWSLLWQLQVASFFDSNAARVSWTPKGPDLEIDIDAGTFYVECYSYQKSFGLKFFIEEVFHRIDPRIRVDHRWYLPFSLPKNQEADSFLDKLFTPFLDDSYLVERKREAAVSYPAPIAVPDGTTNFFVYVEGDGQGRYDSSVYPNYSGAPENYLEVVMREVVRNKQRSNRIAQHRPNVLAVNCLLSHEFYCAEERREDLGEKDPDIEFGDSLDAVLMASCGICSGLTSFRMTQREDAHPMSTWMKKQGLI